MASTKSAAPTRAYPDLHDHLRALEEGGHLVRVDRPINKDTEMHPLVRWQFRGGFPEHERKAFLFTNVEDAKGKKYDIPVVVGCLAASREIYRIGLDCPLDKIAETWTKAEANPITPKVVETAPCQEIVITGADLDKEGMGLDSIPVPISTPGWDNAPYTTLSQYITKDPDTGVQNLGNYRGQVKTRRRLGMNPSLELRPGHLHALAQIQEDGPEDARCRDPRRAAGDHVHVEPEDARARRRVARRGRARRLADQCRARARPSICWFRRRPRSWSRASSTPNGSSPRRRSARATATSTCRSTTPTWR